MTTVARQITVTSMKAAPVPTILPQSHPQGIGVKPYVKLHDSAGASPPVSSRVEAGGRLLNKDTKTNGKSPPPPPARTTSAKTTASRPLHKEDVVIHNKEMKRHRPAPPPPVFSSEDDSSNLDMVSSLDITFRRSLVSQGDEVVRYTRGHSNTENSQTLDQARFNTIQHRGRMHFNPYTATMERTLHSKFSSSQPHLNIIDQQGLVRPNDRIRLNTFDNSSDEQDSGLGEEYGSGYKSNLMKMSHGDIQKHTVAVTTPRIPPNTNRADSGSEKSPSPPSVKVGTSDLPGDKKDHGIVRRENSNLSDSTSTPTPSVIEAGALNSTSSIAKAYREHLIEKMEREKHSTSSSPSPSAASSSGTEGPNSMENVLSSKLRNVTPSQLQAALDVPERAFFPRILPPQGSTGSKQEQLSKTMDSGGHPSNPFQEHTKYTNMGYDIPDDSSPYSAFPYGTLPRKMIQPQGGTTATTTTSMLASQRAQSVRELSQIGHGPDSAESNRLNSLSSSYSGASQTPSRELRAANVPAYLKYQDFPMPEMVQQQSGGKEVVSLSDQFQESYSSSASNSSTQSSSTAQYPGSLQTQPDLIKNLSRTSTHQVAAKPKGSNGPPIMPKPAILPRHNRPLTQTANVHERSTSDPAPSYGPSSSQVPPTKPAENSLTSSIPSPNPLTPYPHSGGPIFDSSAEYQLRKGMSSSPHFSLQYGRLKPKLHTGVQQMSTSLLEIREADEIEEKDIRKSGSEVRFFDYVSLNSTLLPKRVRVGQEFHSRSKDVAISKGEEFDLHFVRQTKSVSVTDSNNVCYAVPLNSVVRFSILYDPFGVERVAMMGFYFKTAGVIMDLRSPPSVVAATRNFDGGRIDSSVEESEILVIDSIKNVFHGRLLKVFSLKHKIVKHLDESCVGDFTTTPSMLRMSLGEIYDCSVPLPKKAQLYPPSTILTSIPPSLQTSPVILERFMVAKSVVATPSSESGIVPVSKSALSISLDLDIEVLEISLSEKQVTKMQEKTGMLLNDFRNLSITPYMDMPSSVSHVTQRALLLNLDPNPKFTMPRF